MREGAHGAVRTMGRARASAAARGAGTYARRCAAAWPVTPCAPRLAVPLAVKGATGKDGLDALDQSHVGHGANRSGSSRLSPRRGTLTLEGRSCRTPEPTDPGYAIGLAAARGIARKARWAAHSLDLGLASLEPDLRRAKGRPSSSARILASSNSRSSSISPSLAFSRSLSRSAVCATPRHRQDGSSIWPRHQPGTHRASRSMLPL